MTSLYLSTHHSSLMLIATEESKEIEGGGEKRQIENPEKVL